MKTCMLGLLAVGVCASLLLTGGCVSKEEYNKALTMNRRANEQLQSANEQLRAAQGDKADLAAKIADQDATLSAKEKEVALLEGKNQELQSSLDKLQDLYDKAMQSAPPRPVGSVILLPTPVDQALREFASQNPELVEYLPAYGMVKFKADFTFDKGSDDVSSGASEALGKLVDILNSPAAAKFHVYVAGHTDDIPIEKPDTLRRHPTNWYLSVHRSVEVEKALEKSGLSPERIGVMGFSEYHPVEANASGNKGNPKNRRVEIWIVPPGRFLTEPSAGGAAVPAGKPVSEEPAPTK
jgi:flagellar motor protein MotB